MQRRQFLASLAAATPLLAGKAPRFDMKRISFITDEAAASSDDAVAFAHRYGLKWMELREVPGAKKHYGLLSEEEAKKEADKIHESGLRVSFLNTPFFKITLPGHDEPRGTETVEKRDARIAKHKADFERRRQDFETAFRNCHVYGVKNMRVFTFLRTPDPRSTFQQVADILGEVTEWAAKEDINILFENETSCNVVTCDECADFLKMMPQKNFAFNWDPLNGADLKEVPFPDGYAKLPKNRILNVQAKGKSLLEPDKKLDWRGIFSALSKDGYTGCVGLETHYFDGTKIEKSHKSIEEIRRILVS